MCTTVQENIQFPQDSQAEIKAVSSQKYDFFFQCGNGIRPD